MSLTQNSKDKSLSLVSKFLLTGTEQIGFYYSKRADRIILLFHQSHKRVWN